MKRSLLLLLPLLLLLLGGGMLLWSVQRQGEGQRREFRRQVEETAGLLATLLQEEPTRVPPRLSEDRDWRVLLLGPHGEILLQADEDKVLPLPDPSQLRRVRLRGQGEFLLAAETSFYCKAVVLPGEGNILLVARPVGELEEAVARQRVRITLGGVLLVAGALWLGGAWWRLRLHSSLSSLPQLSSAANWSSLLEICRREAPLRPWVPLLERLRQQDEADLQLLREEGGHFRELLDHSPQALFLLDHRNRLVLANAALRKTLPGSPVAGRALLEVIRSVELENAANRARNGNEEVQGELQLGNRIFQFALRPLPGRSAWVMGYLSDITPLRQAELIRRDFVSNVSHELKTPLTSIRGYAETLLQEENLTPVQKEFLQRIEAKADQLRELTEELLRLADTQGGRWEAPTPVLLRELRGELQRLFAERLREQRLLFQGPWEEGSCLTSAPFLRSILYNLIDNAIKYGGRGEIRVTVLEEGEAWIFSVQDQGPGIPPQERARVFERFYRGEGARAVDPGGTGLGLAIAKHMVLALEGSIWIEEPPGGGACLKIRLPKRTGRK